MNMPVLLPVFVLIALLFGLGFWMGAARFMAVSGGAVRAKDIALGQSAWPPRVTQIGRAYHNQLELPLVFYALVALVLAVDAQSATFVALEWLYAGLRLAHAFIHVTSNNLRTRFLLFAAGMLVLLAMWIWFFARIVIGA